MIVLVQTETSPALRSERYLFSDSWAVHPLEIPIDRSPLPGSVKRNVMDIRPLHDRIVVRRLAEGEQTIGAIIIPDTAKEKPQRGEVIAAGRGKVKDDGGRVPLDVKPGDQILFGKYTSQEVRLDGEEYLIMREDEVLAVLGGGGTTDQK
jgi:chaperonin GroES